jgi:membrane-associated phospholipid phosphatase
MSLPPGATGRSAATNGVRLHLVPGISRAGIHGRRARGASKAFALALVFALALPLTVGAARADTGERAGDIASILLPAGAAAGALLAKDGEGLVQLAQAFATTMAVVYVLKPTIDRTRPDGGRHAFPSGHAASAFAGAAFLQRRYGWRLGVPACVLAGYVGYSRVESDRHHPTDVVAGAAIGIAANLVFTRPRQPVSVRLDVGRGHAAAFVTIVW